MIASAAYSVCYDRSGVPVRLGAERGRGGEGTIYDVEGASGLVAKLYHPEKLASPDERQARERKLLAMLAAPVRCADAVPGTPLISWPQRALYDAGGGFCGFIMPRVASRYKLETLYQATTRRRVLPGLTWSKLMVIAFNLAFAVEAIHAAGHVIGDLNDQNILISDQGLVTLIDTDSFDIREMRGEHYPCRVGMAQYIAPELQGHDLSGGGFTAESDRFALAVHIFRLLMDGHHPYHCSRRSESGSAATSPILPNITGGRCAYTRRLRGYLLPPGAPDYSNIPPVLQALFASAFAGTARRPFRSRRPTAADWELALGAMHAGGEITICISNAAHEYYSRCDECPWCAAERRQEAARERVMRRLKRRAPLESSLRQRMRRERKPAAPVASRRRDGRLLRAWPLYLSCIAAGLLAGPVLCALCLPWLGRLFERAVGIAMPSVQLMITLSLTGAVVGWLAAYLLSSRYRGSPAPLLYLPVPLLVPVGAAAGMFAVSFVCSSLVAFIILAIAAVAYFAATQRAD